VAQLPFATGDPWVGLDLAGTAPASRLSLVAFSPRPAVAAAGIAGLNGGRLGRGAAGHAADHRAELHYDDPIARAPQAILLAVRPDDFPEWTFEGVEGSVLEHSSLPSCAAWIRMPWGRSDITCPHSPPRKTLCS